jgi:hypothetical protein
VKKKKEEEEELVVVKWKMAVKSERLGLEAVVLMVLG